MWSTWAIIAVLLALVVTTYNLFPDFEDPRWVGVLFAAVLCCAVLEEAMWGLRGRGVPLLAG